MAKLFIRGALHYVLAEIISVSRPVTVAIKDNDRDLQTVHYIKA